MLCVGSGVASAAIDSVETNASIKGVDSLEWIPSVEPNSEDETYLRYLQIAGVVRQYPWSSRGFSPREARKLGARIGAHPWSRSGKLTAGSSRARLLPVSAELRGNSAVPYGPNDGAVWAGRGVTASATIGLAMQAGPVSLVLAPTAFVTQNAGFDLLDNGQTGRLHFADGLVPLAVDRPQRFGDKAYGRVDPGNSTLRADIGPIAAGISTANMAWGPFELYPYVLGTNAPGFVHGFVGTSRPVNVGIGAVHGRVIWGRLEQSAYSPVDGEPAYVSISEPGTRRFASGIVALFTPRGVGGLELGVTRFFHSPWPRSGIPASYLGKPFEGILKSRLKGAPGFSDPSSSTENQLISGFARWAFPSTGLELYAEYGREDHSWDKRDFTQEPDHSRSYGLGVRKTLRMRPELLDGFTMELINFQLSHLARTGRGEGGLYVHSVMRQGHTNRGQLLGADVGIGAASGSTIRWDRYRPRSRTALSLHRTVRQELSDFYLDGDEDAKSIDVQYALEGMRMRRLRSVELSTEVALVRGLNRNFQKDVTSISALVRVLVPLRR